MRIIDTHQHVFWHGRDDGGLVADMDEQGIESAWLLTWEIPAFPPSPDQAAYIPALNPTNLRPDGTHAGIPLAELLIAKRRFPDRFVLGYCPDPQLPQAAEMFASAVKIHGVRVCGEWKFRMPIDDPRCLQLFRMAGRHGAPVVLHLDVPYLPDETGTMVYQPAWYGGTVENLERALRACPETNFIGHAPGFWREISADAGRDPAAYPKGPLVRGGRLIRLLESYPNLYADLSAGSGLTALKRDPAHAREFVTRFADRLLFGRDIYGGELLSFLRTLELPEAVQRKIYHENALRLVKG